MKRTRFLILISVVAIQSIFHVTLAQFTINDKAVVYNATDSIFMCAISDSLFATDYPAKIHPDTIFRMDQYFDTIITMDTIVVLDTITLLDTVVWLDTVYMVDTVIALDTISLTDTLVWHSMRLNDTILQVNDSIVFEDVRGNKAYHLTAYFNNGDSMCYAITFTNLPIVVLEGEFGYDYVEGGGRYVSSR